jgi:hypothetical protein
MQDQDQGSNEGVGKGRKEEDVDEMSGDYAFIEALMIANE